MGEELLEACLRIFRSLKVERVSLFVLKNKIFIMSTSEIIIFVMVKKINSMFEIHSPL